ncbi:HigA family addiction module antitoxin [Paraburkholderia sp. RL17-383-BIF-A]|uniref:HigA family addiction module antitoxin n=1 Tax=Paraburkholderia sp. RL17-383-BIF-A TaxID=3031631 RepID=UPI0038B989AA
MTEPRTKPRPLSMLERMEEAARQAWPKNERIRHEEFVQALRDPSRAASTIADARGELARWEGDTTRLSGEIAGWREVLSFPAEKIATLLEEQSHPLLKERNHESPFGPGRDDVEAEVFRQEMRERRQPADRMQGIRAMVREQRQLSLVSRAEARYCSPMSHPDPSHPGFYVREQCLERFELSVTEGARVLGVSRQALTNLITGKAGISPEMALRLDLAFGGGAETWLQRQLLHDLAQARRRLTELNVVPVASERQPALF